MKKKLFRRCASGAPTGLMVCVLLNLFFSYLRRDSELRIGYYLIRVYGSEVNAISAMVLGSMLIGGIWSAASLIFESERSLLLQTIAHAVCCVIPSLAIAWLLFWIPRTLDGIVQYASIFAGIYVLVWIIQYGHMRRRIRKFNAKLNEWDRQ